MVFMYELTESVVLIGSKRTVPDSIADEALFEALVYNAAGKLIVQRATVACADSARLVRPI